MRILVVGASGYIGGRLVPLLASQGHELILMSRDARPLANRFPQTRVVIADLLDPPTLPAALARVDVAYYLAHSMGAGERGFAERDRQAARNFAQAARRGGVSTTWPAATKPAPSSPHMACRSPSSARR
jgi:uncharacterized protein YbjT (DUF2867 family)